VANDDVAQPAVVQEAAAPVVVAPFANDPPHVIALRAFLNAHGAEAPDFGDAVERFALAQLRAATSSVSRCFSPSDRRHRPGRGFEAVRYRFEVVADYGAFRDLQRHRMLTVQWQTLGPELGAGVPDELEQAGVADDYKRGLEASAAEYQRLADGGQSDAAPYALCLGYRIRFILDCNAREAMQLIELRSGREGHPSYRAVAHEMQRAIAQHHPAVAASMVHVDNQAEPRLERILSEMRTEARSG
jgi:hypothetical protein